MEKIMLSTSNADFIVEIKPVPEMENNAIKWVDRIKSIAMCKKQVNSIVFYNDTYSEPGYHTYQKIWLRKEDILRLADKVKEVEASESFESHYEDLPF